MPVPQKINKPDMHLRDFISDVYRDYPVRANIAILCVLSAGVLEGVGFSAVLPLLSGLFSKQIPDGGLLTAWMPDFLKNGNIWVLTGFILAVFSLKSLFSYTAKRFVEKIAVDFEIGIKKKVVSDFLDSEWRFASSQKSGFLMSLVGEHSVMAGNAFRLLIQFLGESLNILVYLSLGFLISFQSFVPSLFIGLVSFLAVKRMIVRSKAVSSEIASMQSSLHGEIFEDLVAVKFLKANHLEPYRLERIRTGYDRLGKKMFKRYNYGAVIETFPEVLAVAFVCLFLVVSRQFFGVAAEGGLLLSMIIYRLGRKGMEIQTSRQRLVVNLPSYFICRQFILEASQARVLPGAVKVSGFETLELVRVGFTYPGSGEVLRDVNLKIEKNKLVVISGRSGSGKTTLLDLIVGLNHPTCGKVLINGIDAAGIDLFSWRDSVAYVSQESILYDMSIEDNLRLGNPEVSRERLEAACCQTDAHEFILAQPQGYATVIGNRGLNLSGGQRQRLVFARALLRGPKLLILDEPTSALDTASEEVVRSLIQRLRGKVNILLVSHRSSLLENADIVYSMDEQSRPEIIGSPRVP